MTKRLSVLFITNYPAPYRVDFFNLLGKQVDLTVSFCNTPEEQKHRDASWFNDGYENFKAVFLKKRIKISDKELHSGLKRLLKNHFDFIIFCGYSSPTFMVAMERLKHRGVKYLFEADGGLIGQDSKITFDIKKHFISSADGWFSSGDETSKYLIHYGADKDKIYKYPFSSLFDSENNRYPRDSYDNWLSARSAARSAARAELNVSSSKVVLYVGQFVEGKGVDTLLSAAKNFNPGTVVYVVGGTPTDEYLKIVEENKLDNIVFVGFKAKEELSKYYEMADVVVMPTRHDVWGLVINESMSFGLPVVSSDMCVAGNELIHNGVNGYVVPVDDSDALADKVNLVLNGDSDKMGYEAYLTIEEFTIENMCRRHMEAFEQLSKDKNDG